MWCHLTATVGRWFPPFCPCPIGRNINNISKSYIWPRGQKILRFFDKICLHLVFSIRPQFFQPTVGKIALGSFFCPFKVLLRPKLVIGRDQFFWHMGCSTPYLHYIFFRTYLVQVHPEWGCPFFTNITHFDTPTFLMSLASFWPPIRIFKNWPPPIKKTHAQLWLRPVLLILLNSNTPTN